MTNTTDPRAGSVCKGLIAKALLSKRWADGYGLLIFIDMVRDFKHARQFTSDCKVTNIKSPSQLMDSMKKAEKEEQHCLSDQQVFELSMGLLSTVHLWSMKVRKSSIKWILVGNLEPFSIGTQRSDREWIEAVGHQDIRSTVRRYLFNSMALSQSCFREALQRNLVCAASCEQTFARTTTASDDTRREPSIRSRVTTVDSKVDTGDVLRGCKAISHRDGMDGRWIAVCRVRY